MPARQIIARARAGSGEGRVNFKTAVDRALRQIGGAGFTIEYWDGERVDYGSGKPRFMLLVKTASVARGILRNPLVRLPEAYVDGDIELQGNLLDLLEFCYQSDEAFLNFSAWQRGAARLWSWRRRNSTGRRSAGSRRPRRNSATTSCSKRSPAAAWASCTRRGRRPSTAPWR